MSDDTIDTTDEPVDDTTTSPNGEDEDPSVEVSDGGTSPNDEQDQDDVDFGRQGREAAKYRRRLRAVEAERDELTQRLEAMQRSEVERQAAAAQLRPAALWSAATLPDLLNEDGTVDADKVDAAIAAARDVLGLPTPKQNYVPVEGRTVASVAARSTVGDMINAVMGRSD